MRSPISLSGLKTDDPKEIMTEVTDVLHALAVIFMGDAAPDLDHRASAGISHILSSSIRSLESAETLVSEQISDPMTVGYQRGSALANSEYRRGVSEERENFLKTVQRRAPDLHSALLALIKDTDAQQNSTSGSGGA
jgi:hypothetical protein